jgi:hypothetical protein
MIGKWLGALLLLGATALGACKKAEPTANGTGPVAPAPGPRPGSPSAEQLERLRNNPPQQPLLHPPRAPRRD